MSAFEFESKLIDLKEQRAELMAQADRLAELDSPSDLQCKQLNELLDRITNVDDRARIFERKIREAGAERKIQQRLESGEILGDVGRNGGGSAKMQIDSHGRRFAILNQGDRVTDIHRPVCENQFGHFVLAKLFGPTNSTPAEIRNALSESDNISGGFTVPNPLSSQIIELARNQSVVLRAGAQTVLMESESLSVPKLETDPTIAVKGENTAFTPTDITFGQRELNAYLAGCVVELSRELAEDSTSLTAQFLESTLASAMAAQVDKWAIQGTGSAQPLGLINMPGIDETGSVGAIDHSDMNAAVVEVLKANHRPNAAIMNPEIYGDLMSIEGGDGANSTRHWLGSSPLMEGVSMFPSNNCPTANIIVGDMSKLLWGVRTGAMVETTTSGGDAFKKHQLLVKITSRFDFVAADETAFHRLAGVTT